MQHICLRLRMHAVRIYIAISVVSGLAALSLSGSAWADNLPCTPSTTGPTGPDAAAFTYQCDGTYAGEWTSPYYVYNSTTGTETPLYAETYNYDCTNNQWLQNEWHYNTDSDSYEEKWIPATTAPNQATDCTNTGTNLSAGSTNSDSSTAASGDAVVAGNGDAGNATSGTGSTEVTDTNTVNSSAAANTTTFTVPVTGTTNGDLVLDPSQVPPSTGNTQETQQPAVAGATTDNSLSNTITATAASGDAVVAGNGDAGNATSGNAQTIVNLINMINSAVAAGQSFIGTVNIYGDLNGNILIPQSVVDQILASNTDANSNPNLAADTNESIVNNVNATAKSGNAVVADNAVNYGTATTGSATANVATLNLTNSSVIGQNVLLVLVNVLGQWTGMIVNAPAGATSAEFAGGITSDTPSTDASVIDANASLNITNNVNATATTGNALVVRNQNAGNATSGNAAVAVNILNIENSDLSSANWFGILFINVFGVWNGNFGILPTPTSTTPNSNTSLGDGIATTALATAQHYTDHFATFVPAVSPTTTATGGSNTPAAVLGDSAIIPTAKKTATPISNSGTHVNYLLSFVGVGLAGVLLLISERDRIFHPHEN